MDDFNDDSRFRLYRNFRENILDKSKDHYYDESELVEIFDCAGDQDDSVVRIEVLNLAARFYPDSDSLKLRKVIYYMSIGELYGAGVALASVQSDSLLFQILKLQFYPPALPGCEQVLDELLEKYNEIDDEEIIQIIALANELNQKDWALSRLDVFRQKTSYIPTVLYEIAVHAASVNNSKVVLKMTEELTRLEPFVDVYWSMLGKAYADLGESEKAISALDYALAINPENDDACLLRAQLKLLEGPVDNELAEALSKVIEKSPNNEPAVKTLGLIYQALGDPISAVRVYGDYAMLYDRSDFDVLESLLELKPNTYYQNQFFRYYADEGKRMDEGLCVAMAERLNARGLSESAASLLNDYNRQWGLTFGYEIYISSLCVSKSYCEIVKELTPRVEGLIDAELSSVASLCYVFSLIKLWRYKDAKDYATRWLSEYRNLVLRTPKERLVAIGVCSYMDDVVALLEKGDNDKAEQINPFILLFNG